MARSVSHNRSAPNILPLINNHATIVRGHEHD